MWRYGLIRESVACGRKGSTFSQWLGTDHAEKGGADAQRGHKRFPCVLLQGLNITFAGSHTPKIETIVQVIDKTYIPVDGCFRRTIISRGRHTDNLRSRFQLG
jgi:hypothetical protein